MTEEFITFKLSRIETERAKAFIAKHKEEEHTIIRYYKWDILKLFPRLVHEDYNQQGETFIYKITPTGIGDHIEIICDRCGKSEDITDYDAW